MISVSNTEINNKITEQIRKKCESNGIKENVFINNKIIYNRTPTNLKFISKTDKSNSKSPFKKFIYNNENNINTLNHNFSENLTNRKIKPLSFNNIPLEEDNIICSLSSRIEKYCVISKRLIGGKNKNSNNFSNCKSEKSGNSNKKSNKKNNSKSPIKIFFGDKENELNMNSLVKDIINNNKEENFNKINEDTLNISGYKGNSLKNLFDWENFEEKSNDMSSKFKARPLKNQGLGNNFNFAELQKKKNEFSNKNQELISFQSVIEKTKQDKYNIEKNEKNRIKIDMHIPTTSKITEILMKTNGIQIIRFL